MRASIAAVVWTLVLGAGCVDDPTETDAVGASSDLLAVGVDLAPPDEAPPDATAPPDLAPPPDLAVAPDLLFIPPDAGISVPELVAANQGLAGADVRGLATNGARLFAMTPRAVFSANTDGLAWTRHEVSTNPVWLEHIAAVDGFSGPIYVATSNGAIFKTENDPIAFTPVDLTGGPTTVDALFVQRSQGALWVRSGTKLFRMRGGVWKEHAGPGGFPTMFAESDSEDGVFLATLGGVSQVIESTPDTITWSPVTGSLAASQIYVTGSATSVPDPIRLVTYRDEVSYFDGSEWSATVPTLAGETVAGLGLDATLLFVFGRRRVLTWEPKSSASGWTPSLEPLGIETRRALVPGSTSNLFLATSAGVIASADHSSWFLRNAGFDAANVNRFAGGTTLDRILAATPHGLFRSVDRGQTWMRANGLPTFAAASGLAVSRGDPTIVYVGVGNRIYHSSDEGLTFDGVYTTDASELSAMAVSHQGPTRLLYCGASALHLSIDNGNSDEPITLPIANSGCRAVLFDPDDAGHAFAVLDTTLLESSDGGATWSQAAGALVQNNVTELQFDATTPARVYLISSGEVRVWQTGDTAALAPGLPSNETPRTLAIDPANPKILYLGTNLGLRMSTDRGATFTPVAGLPQLPVSTLFVHPLDRRLRLVAVDNAGVFRSEGTLLP